MHTPHIKPQNFNYPIGLQSRAAKTKKADPDLVLPASEWECNGKRRDRRFELSRPDDAPENADEAFGPSSVASGGSDVARRKAPALAAKGVGDPELQKLLDAISVDRPVAPLPEAFGKAGGDEPSLADLLESAAQTRGPAR